MSPAEEYALVQRQRSCGMKPTRCQFCRPRFGNYRAHLPEPPLTLYFPVLPR